MAENHRDEGRIDRQEPKERDRADETPDPARHEEVTETGGKPDHSEREWGNDQDIDTFGMIPENKKTKNTEPIGF